MKRLLLLAAALMVVVGASAASRKLKNSDTQKFQYEIEGVNNGTQGTYLVKVWTYSASKNANIETCKKNAVHGIIFKVMQALPMHVRSVRLFQTLVLRWITRITSNFSSRMVVSITSM